MDHHSFSAINTNKQLGSPKKGQPDVDVEKRAISLSLVNGTSVKRGVSPIPINRASVSHMRRPDGKATIMRLDLSREKACSKNISLTLPF
ncbi:hypothetical protein [Pseudomonas canadensis]|uniref:hypothetical protein n=1 Tax=Pseudomonas canadensis TaxID=915099 RepID=UPI001F9ED547|nr:hypothetical protein [Pseudomonas canadensis]